MSINSNLVSMDWMETLANIDCNDNPRTVERKCTAQTIDPSLPVRMLNGKPVYRIGQREAETLEDYHCRMQIDLHPIMERSRQRWLVETVSHGVRDPMLRERCKEAAEYYNMYHNFPQYTFWAEHTEAALRSGDLRKDETIAQWVDRLLEEEKRKIKNKSSGIPWNKYKRKMHEPTVRVLANHLLSLTRKRTIKDISVR